MTLSFLIDDVHQTLTLNIGPVVLLGGCPIVNDQPLVASQVEIIRQSSTDITLRVTAPILANGVFGLTVSSNKGLVDEVGTESLQIHYWLANLPESFVLDSFGIRFTAIENMRAYLPVGYTCWDGATYQEPEAMPEGDADRAEKGFALTQIIPRFGGGSVILGFDHHDRFQHTFQYDTRHTPVGLTIQTMWDRKTRNGLRCESERLIAYAHPQVEDALRTWAKLVAGVSPLPPRITGPGITGWSSWYNLYATIT